MPAPREHQPVAPSEEARATAVPVVVTLLVFQPNFLPQSSLWTEKLKPLVNVISKPMILKMLASSVALNAWSKWDVLLVLSQLYRYQVSAFAGKAQESKRKTNVNLNKSGIFIWYSF